MRVAKNEWLAEDRISVAPLILADATALILPAWLACTVIVSLPVLAKRLRWLAEIELTAERRRARVGLNESGAAPACVKNTVGATDDRHVSADAAGGSGRGRGWEAATDAGVVDVVVAVGVLRHELVLGA